MFTKEKNWIDKLLSENKPEEAVDYIIANISNDRKDINRCLFTLQQLSFISGNYHLPFIGNTFKSKAITKAEKLLSGLKSLNRDELYVMLLCFEATIEDAIHKNKVRNGQNEIQSIKNHLQKTITNYWIALRHSFNVDERYNQYNNIANSLAFAGRFVEALDLLKGNFETDPSRHQSYASWSITAEKLKYFSILPDTVSFYCVVLDNYMKAINADSDGNTKYKLATDVSRIQAKFNEQLNQEFIQKNRVDEKSEFDKFSDYRKFVLLNKLSLNEHALHCFCRNSEKDNLNIGFDAGSVHLLNSDTLKTIERIFSRVKSEYSFARLLYYKYIMLEDDDVVRSEEFYLVSDIDDIKSLNNDEYEPFKYEHLRLAYRLLYSILDKLARIILLLFDVDSSGKHIYFENVFNHFPELKNIENKHLYALYSISLDLSREVNDSKGALKIYKDIRNKFEHDILIIHNKQSNIQEGELNIDEFIQYIKELFSLSRAAIFSVTFLIRTETMVERM